MKLKKEHQLYIATGGIAVVLGAIGISFYKIYKKIANPSAATRVDKENKQLKNLPVNVGKEGYVNVRSYPKIDNKNYVALDFTDNLLQEVSTNPIGYILERLKGEDGYYWFKIKLETPVNGKSEGYVREDVVIIEK